MVHAPVGVSQPLNAHAGVAECSNNEIGSERTLSVLSKSNEPLIEDAGREAMLAVEDSTDLCLIEEIILECGAWASSDDCSSAGDSLERPESFCGKGGGVVLK